MHAQTSDIQLLDQWRVRRDPDAFAELVSRYGPLVYSACLRVLRCQVAAEDAAQDCFVELLQTRAPVRSLPAYLHTSATHRALDRLKSERRRTERESRYAQARPDVHHPNWDDLSEHIDAAIAALPEKLQQPLVLRFLRGYTYAQIATETGLPASTVQYRLEKGIDRVRQHLGQRGIYAGAGALAALLAAAPANAMPVSATAKLGALALSGGVLPSATAALPAYAGIGGLIMVKQIVAVVTVLGAILAGWMYLHPDTPPPEEGGTSRAVADQVENRQDSQPATAPELISTAERVPTDVVDVGAAPQIAGIALDPRGKPVAAAQVVYRGHNLEESTQTNGLGEFSFPLAGALGIERTNETSAFWMHAEADFLKAFPTRIEVGHDGLSGITLQMEATGAMSGSVIDESGNPLPGWRVVASDAEPGEAIPADERGAFAFTHLRPGDYRLFARQGEAGSLAYYDGGGIRLKAGEHVTGLTLVYAESGLALEGHVAAVDGTPIGGVSVSASYRLGPDFGSQGFSISSETDESGYYTIAGFSEPVPAEVDLYVLREGYMNDQRIGVVLDGHAEDFTLLKRPVISGRVLDASTREPVTQFRLNHWMISGAMRTDYTDQNLSWSNHWEIQKNDEGRFEIQLTGYNQVFLSCAAPGYVSKIHSLGTVAPEDVKDDVELLLEAAVPLTGVVVDELGAPIADARIFIGYPASRHSSGADGLTRSDKNGEFSLSEYPPNLSIVSASHADYASAWIEAKGGQPLRITLTRGGTIEGTVFSGGIPADNVAAEISIQLDSGYPGMLDTTHSPAGGKFAFNKVPGGSITLSAGYHLGKQRQFITREVQVGAGETIHETFDFGPLPSAYIEGVLLLDDQPCVVSLLRATATLGNGDTVLYQVETRADGTFTLGPLPGGAYELAPLWMKLEDGSYLEPDPIAVAVEDGETTNHDLLFSSR